jgi:hypothetical protein
MNYSHYHLIKECNYTTPQTAKTNTKYDFVWMPLHHCKKRPKDWKFLQCVEDSSLPGYDDVSTGTKTWHAQTQKMEVASSSNMLATTYKSTQHHIPEAYPAYNSHQSII